MMKKKIAVIYQTHYGATAQYANWIAGDLGADLIERKKTNAATLAAYDVVVYGGGIYAGGILGVSLVSKHPSKHLVVYTVGLADPETTDYSDIIDRCFPEGRHRPEKIFHFRGSIDYKKLSLVSKTLMAMVKKSAQKKPEEERSNEDKIFLETYGERLDFIDREAIAPLVEYVEGIVRLKPTG
jgi:menaquinone-dependent protoporphyrinogen IX oxidase